MRNNRIRWTLPAALVALAVMGGPPGRAGEAPELRVFYFGNSFLENSVPWFHPGLAKTAGRELRVRTSLGPGWQIWMHTDSFDKGHAWARGSLLKDDWNGVVIQHFANPGLSSVVPYKWDGPGRCWFYPPRDVGDVASAAEIIDLLLSARPDARVFIYNSWPGIPGVGDFMRRVREETQKSLEAQGMDREEVLRKVRERKPTYEEMIPLYRSFDYEAVWLAEYDQNDPEKSRNTHTHSYCVQLMEGLKQRFPELWREGRLALIPNGEVFLALDKKMRAGRVPGIENVGFFSRDGGHVRAGLPRYTLAATCFAVMFRQNPEGLDYAVYNDLANYTNESIGKLGMGGYVHQPDLGKLLEITPERAKIVNETVWEVVSDHPYTAVRP